MGQLTSLCGPGTSVATLSLVSGPGQILPPPELGSQGEEVRGAHRSGHAESPYFHTCSALHTLLEG